MKRMPSFPKASSGLLNTLVSRGLRMSSPSTKMPQLHLPQVKIKSISFPKVEVKAKV